MANISQMSDEELMAIAKGQKLSSMSDEELLKISGQQPQEQQTQQPTGQITGQDIQEHPIKALLRAATQPVTQSVAGTTLGQQYDKNLGATPFAMMDSLGQGKNPLAQANAFGQSFTGGLAADVADMVQTPANLIGGLLGKSAKPSISSISSKIKPKIYNDAVVTNIGRSMVNKIEGIVKPLRDSYKSVTSPHENIVVSGEVFEEALQAVPKALRKDLAEAYKINILDATGKPQTTLRNLQRMEGELKDVIQQPEFGAKINTVEFNVAEAAKKIKSVRLSQYPREAQEMIASLDKKFGSAIKVADELLPKLADKNGVINTKFLSRVFKNPAEAGMRNYMRNLRNTVGIDLTPEMKIGEGWIGRQALKSLLQRTSGKVVEGGAIGGVIGGVIR